MGKISWTMYLLRTTSYGLCNFLHEVEQIRSLRCKLLELVQHKKTLYKLARTAQDL